MDKIKYFLTFLVLVTASAWGKTVSLDLREPGFAGKRMLAVAAQSENEGKVRSFNLKSGAANVGEVEVGDEITFWLFDDVEITLKLSKRLPSPLGGEVFLAVANGSDGVVSAVVLRTDFGLTIDMYDFLQDKTYKVVSAVDGVKVAEIEPTGEGTCGCDALSVGDCAAKVGKSVPASTMAKSGMLAASSPHQDDTCVDILIAYDRNAAAYAMANGGGITNFAQVAVAKMNTALANTGLDAYFRFRLVGVTTVSVSAGDVHSALYAIRDREAGWADIPAYRDRVGADIVTTLVDTGSAYGTAGVGWSLESESSLASFGPYAYNVCAIRSVAQSHTMTHEVGHNMGCGHSLEQVTQPGPQLYPYSAGFYFAGKYRVKYCTIMAYPSEGIGGTRVPFFSSPNHYYSDAVVGSSLHDNTRTLANTCSYAAKWREQIVPDAGYVVFDPASGKDFGRRLQVTLAPSDGEAEIRYTLDGSDPNASSPVYSGPITLTRTTTIKACTVIDGVCSLPNSAFYFSHNDIGYMLGHPEMEWTSKGPWGSQWYQEPCDDALSEWVLGVTEGNAGDVSEISTRIDGVATIQFSYLHRPYHSEAELLCDGIPLWKSVCWRREWQDASVNIPKGEHEIVFRLTTVYPSGTSSPPYFGLRNLRMYQTYAPSFNPPTSDDSTRAFCFAGEMAVSLTAEEDAQIFYTLDGKDPAVEGAIHYDGPFFICESTRVKAIAVGAGKSQSLVVEGCYAKRGDPPKAGEWTHDGDGAIEEARNNGRMIAFRVCDDPCSWCDRHYESTSQEVFRTWAAVNGIYLVDVMLQGISSPDSESLGKHFLPFWSQTDYGNQDISTPSYVFVHADGATVLGAMRGSSNTTGLDFTFTPRSMMECFASHLGASAILAPPVISDTTVVHESYPFEVTLENPNVGGTIYYTLDGSPPTRENGVAYTGFVSIPEPGTTIKAVVWPDAPGGVCGEPAVFTYKTLTTATGLKSAELRTDVSRPWSFEEAEPTDNYPFILKPSRIVDQTSSLMLTVPGPGILSFKYYLKFFASPLLEFKINGTTVSSWTESDAATTNLLITASQPTEFEWAYTHNSSEARQSSSACEILSISWTPYVVPDGVTGVCASDRECANGTLVRWNLAKAADSYAVYRARTCDFNLAECIGTTDKDRFWDTGCDADVTYWYWIVASNAIGDSVVSSPAAGRRMDVNRVSFDANGGVGTIEAIYKGNGMSIVFPSNTFSRTGWRFVGWATSPDGHAEFSAGQSFRPGADITFYAVWEKDMVWTVDSAGWLIGVETNGLTKAIVPDGVRYIDSYTFRGFSTITDLELPESLTYIANLSFQDCTGLRSVVFPKSVTNVYRSAFSGCCNIAQAYVPKSLEGTFDENGVFYPYNVRIYYYEDSVGRIIFDANGGVGEMRTHPFVPGVSQPLPENAFVREGFFFGGWAMTPDGEPQYANGEEESFVGDQVTLYARWYASATVSFCANGGVGEMPPQTVLLNGECLLQPCAFTWTGWRFVGWATSADGPVCYHDAATLSLSSDMVLYAMWEKDMIWTVNSSGTLTAVDPNGVVNAVIPGTVKALSSYCFTNVVALESVTIHEGVSLIGSCAFSGCTALTNVVFKGAPASFGSGVFKYCTALESVTLPFGFRRVFSQMFWGCTSLKHIVIPDSVKSVDSYAFYGCANLLEVDLPNSVTNIGSSVFCGCKSLSHMLVPSSVSGIGRYAFFDCSTLASVTFEGNAPDVGSDAFSYIASGCVAQVPLSAIGYTVNGDGMWNGLKVEHYGISVGEKGTVEETVDGGYLVKANGEIPLDETDINFGSVPRDAYKVSFTVDGKFATVVLNPPEFGVKAVPGETENKDESDASGFLVEVSEDRITAKPEPTKLGEKVGAMPVKTYQGLYYQAGWGDDLGGLTCGKKVKADGGVLYLGVIKQTGSKGFYKLSVSER